YPPTSGGVPWRDAAKATLAASPAVRGDKGAPPTVAGRHGPPDDGGYVPGCSRVPPVLAGALGRGEPPPFQVAGKQGERAPENLVEVTGGYRVPQQVLRQF